MHIYSDWKLSFFMHIYDEKKSHRIHCILHHFSRPGEGVNVCVRKKVDTPLQQNSFFAFLKYSVQIPAKGYSVFYITCQGPGSEKDAECDLKG